MTALELVTLLRDRRMTVAVAESVTGGLLVAELISVPGASAVVNGGLVAYNTFLKQSLLGVDATLLEEQGPVHPEVAQQMASGVRTRLAIRGMPATLGLSTTGVAGPDTQDGHAVGTVFLGVSFSESAQVLSLRLDGDRAAIRSAAVQASIRYALSLLSAQS